MSMRFTGERVIPEMPEMRVTFLQSLAAYVFVEQTLRQAHDERNGALDSRSQSGRIEIERVLDCGSGEGYGIARLAEMVPVGIGLDQDATAAAWADGKYRGAPAVRHLRFVAGGAEALPFRDDSFDVIVCFQVLEHLPDPAGSLTEMRRVLSPGGRLFLTTPNRLVTGERPNPHHAHDYTADELQELLAGIFGRVEMRGIFGSERAMRYRAANDRVVGRVMRLDPLGVRHRLPDRLLGLLHVASTRTIRGWLNRRSIDLVQQITIDDFPVRDSDLDRAIDLFAICHA